MSKIIKNGPLLNLLLLDDLKDEIELAMGGHGWALTNRITGDKFDRVVNVFVYNSMVKYQLDIILQRATGIYERALAFSKGEYDKYLDEYNEYADGTFDPFDPYTEIGWLLTTDGIDDLPESISLFKELVSFVDTYIPRRKAMKTAFRALFNGDVKPYYRCLDEDDNVIMVPADELPESILEEIQTDLEVRDGLLMINIEHCLDNYDEWFIQAKSIVDNRGDFKSIVALFKLPSLGASPL